MRLGHGSQTGRQERTETGRGPARQGLAFCCGASGKALEGFTRCRAVLSGLMKTSEGSVWLLGDKRGHEEAKEG